MSTTAPELFDTVSKSWADAVQAWVDQSQSMWDQWSAPHAPSRRAREHRGRSTDHGCGCGCREACDCCVPEADVVVHLRVGERRVVPFRLHNPWRREREVTLGVGPWQICSGDGLVVVSAIEAEQVTLSPCEDRIVRLVIGARAANEDTDDDETNASGRFGRDVDDCSSAYADVRFEGCARPQRVAVVVSPAMCDPVDVGCDCGCCC